MKQKQAKVSMRFSQFPVRVGVNSSDRNIQERDLEGRKVVVGVGIPEAIYGGGTTTSCYGSRTLCVGLYEQT